MTRKSPHETPDPLDRAVLGSPVLVGSLGWWCFALGCSWSAFFLGVAASLPLADQPGGVHGGIGEDGVCTRTPETDQSFQKRCLP